MVSEGRRAPLEREAEVAAGRIEAPRITAEEFRELAWQGVPYVGQLGCEVLRFAPGDVVVRLPYRELLRRPGGTICGPALMALADITLYGVVLSLIGRVELAVTSSMSACRGLATKRIPRPSRL